MSWAKLEEGMKIVARIFRRECYRVLESERTTVRGADSMLMALQLVMADVNKQETGEFTVTLSDVLVAWQYLLRDKLHLPLDLPHPENYNIVRRQYDSFLKHTNTVDLIDVHRMYRQLKTDSDPDEPLSSVQLLQFLAGNVQSIEECPQASSNKEFPQTPSSTARQNSMQIRMFLRRIFCSYLDLLVNTKNDLAFAHILNFPCRGLGQLAFRDLRHEARASNMSLFLATTSFVRAVQLGGRGYAPPDSHPLRKHLKGLSDLVNFIDHLEELLGETADPSIAGGKLIGSIRATMLKGRGSGDSVGTATEEVAQDLRERICQIHIDQREATFDSGISPARPKAHAINHATAYGGRDTVKVLKTLLDEEALAPPCRNKAELLYGDHMDFNSNETCLLALFRSPDGPSGTSPKPLRRRVQEQLRPKVKGRVIRSQFACTYRDEDLPLSRVLHFPSTSQLPTCIHPAPKCTVPPERDGIMSLTAVEQASKKGKACKRKLAEGGPQGKAENHPLKKMVRSVDRLSAQPGKKKLIPGQATLTSFFRLQKLISAQQDLAPISPVDDLLSSKTVVDEAAK
ncbi:PCNA-interacting partner-like, partial [Scleropages formosus]